MAGCAAPKCSRNSRHGVRLFRFPSSTGRRSKWLQNSRRDQGKPTNSSRLCEVHFEPCQFEQRNTISGKPKLKVNAIPTLFDVANLPKPPADKRKARKRPICCDEEISESTAIYKEHSYSKQCKSSHDQGELLVYNYIGWNPMSWNMEDATELPVQMTEEDIPVNICEPVISEDEVIAQKTMDAMKSEEVKYDRDSIDFGDMDILQQQEQMILKEKCIFKEEIGVGPEELEVGKSRDEICSGDPCIKLKDLSDIDEDVPSLSIIKREVKGESTDSVAEMTLESSVDADFELFYSLVKVEPEAGKENNDKQSSKAREEIGVGPEELEVGKSEDEICSGDPCIILTDLSVVDEDVPSLSIVKREVKGESTDSVAEMTLESSVDTDFELFYSSVKVEPEAGKENNDKQSSKAGDIIRPPYKNTTCEVCGKTLSRPSGLKNHMKIHDGAKKSPRNECDKKSSSGCNFNDRSIPAGTRSFPCSDCDRKYSSKKGLNKHMISKHGGVKKFPCNVCNKIFYGESKLNDHMLMHAEGKRFTCGECGQKYNLKRNLKSHIICKHGGVKRFPCNDCGKKFYDKYALNSHMFVHSGVKDFRCGHCDRQFSHKNSLNKHMNTNHSDVERFPCNQCGKKFYDQPSCNDHMLVHTLKRILKCGECDQKFNSTAKLKSHGTHVHGQGKSFACGKCDRKYISKEGLARHVSYKHGGRNFSCDSCNWKFHTKGDLNNHVLIHTGVKNFPCEQCDKKFYLKKGLSRHVLYKHVGVRGFLCNVCDKKCLCKSDWKKHMVSHTGIKRFACGECGRKYGYKKSLKAHIVSKHNAVSRFSVNECDQRDLNNHSSHTGEQNFPCDICDKRYTKKKGLIRHFNSKHRDVERFPCNECKQMFYDENNLNVHALSHTKTKKLACF